MASQAVEESSGKDTIEYQVVRSNISKITSALENTLGATKQLSELYKQNEWLSLAVDATETDLVNTALNRIKQEASQFKLFVGMLREIPGMDLTVKTLDITGIDFLC